MAEYPQLLHIVLDTTSPRELADFYRQLLGLQYRGDSRPRRDRRTRPTWSCSWTPTEKPGWPLSAARED
jgi:hypothetical protein